MSKANLVEITKGKVGTGLLIENDGYISMTEGKNKQLYESIIKEDLDGGSSFHCPNPFIVSAVFQKFGIENANGRIYPESVLKRQVEIYQQKIRENRAYGELNHPSETVIDLGRIAMNIKELHWEGHTLVGEIEIITSEGFRKFGICSTIGDQTANLLLKGLKIGVSSRGVGSVEQKMGKMIVGDDYEIICWDVVGDPSTPNAWIAPQREDLQPYIEGTEKKGNLISEKKDDKFAKFDNWLSLND